MNNDISRLQFDLLSNSTTGLANLNGTMIGQMLLAIPPVWEQGAIAAFLDSETAKIDALIAAQRRLIDLLREKRSVLISHAVSKGLNPDAPMKDSGVEWLGEVPEGWDVAPVKTLATCNDGTLPEETDESYELEYVEISGVDVSRGIFETNVLQFGEVPTRARRRVREGDILVSTVRTYLRAIASISRPADNLIASTGFAVT